MSAPQDRNRESNDGVFYIEVTRERRKGKVGAGSKEILSWFQQGIRASARRVGEGCVKGSARGKSA